MTDIDHVAPNWWTTVSGAGTDGAAVESWADDYTRHRSGESSTFTSMDDIIGRSKTGRELDAGLTVSGTVNRY
jgi:hypothetical protein